MSIAPVVFTLSAFWWAQAGGVKSRTKGRLLTCLIWSPSVSRSPIKPTLCVQPVLGSHVASGRQQQRAPHILQGPMNQSDTSEEFKVKYLWSVKSLLWMKTLIWVTLQMFISKRVRICNDISRKSQLFSLLLDFAVYLWGKCLDILFLSVNKFEPCKQNI